MNLIDYASLCIASYTSSEALDETKLNTFSFKAYNQHAQEGLYFFTINSLDGNTLYVTIEGTHDIHDVITDGYAPCEYLLPNGATGNIQAGWLTMAKQIEKLIKPRLITDNYPNVVFVGHSAGASIAMILLLICSKYTARFKAYAFALPRFSDNVVTQYFDDTFDFMVVNNGDDIVPKVYLYFSENAYVTKNVILLSPLCVSVDLKNHSFYTYLDRIKLLYKNVDLLSQVD